MKVSKKILLLCLLNISFLLSIPILVKGAPDPGDVGDNELLPISFSYYYSLRDGDLSSLYYCDGDELVLRGRWLGFIIYNYEVWLTMYFQNTKCDKLRLTFSDTVGSIVNVYVYYTSGDLDAFYSQSDGYHLYNIDSSRYLDYVKVCFLIWGFAIPVGHKYLYVDMCRALPI